MYVQRSIEAPSCNRCCSRKAIIVSCSECVFVALVIQHAKRMHRIVLSYVMYLCVQYFSTLSHEWRGFWGGKKLLNMKYSFRLFFFFCNFRMKHLSFEEEFSEILHDCNSFPCKVPDTLVRF